MANKKLEGIVWPNLPNDVYLLDADKVNYDSEETYSSGSVGKALNDMSADLEETLDDLTALGLTVVDGALCVTYTE